MEGFREVCTLQLSGGMLDEEDLQRRLAKIQSATPG